MSDPGQASSANRQFSDSEITQPCLLEPDSFVLQLYHLGALVGVGDGVVGIQTREHVPYPINAVVDLYATDVAGFTIDDSNVTINSVGGSLAVDTQYAACSLTQTATDVWLLVGNLAS